MVTAVKKLEVSNKIKQQFRDLLTSFHRFVIHDYFPLLQGTHGPLECRIHKEGFCMVNSHEQIRVGCQENAATMNCCSKAVDITFLKGLAQVLVQKVNNTY